jgi:TolB-like protein
MFKLNIKTFQEIASIHDAHYIIEGSVRKIGKMLKITAHLVHSDGKHIWSETYDRDIKDIFDIQEEIAAKI